MDNLNIDYNVIKRTVEKELCIKHKEHPQFKKTVNGFQINACCEEFKSKVVEKAKKALAEQTKIAMQKMINKAFKK